MDSSMTVTIFSHTRLKHEPYALSSYLLPGTPHPLHRTVLTPPPGGHPTHRDNPTPHHPAPVDFSLPDSRLGFVKGFETGP
jgi:hypothetical protein